MAVRGRPPLPVADARHVRRGATFRSRSIVADQVALALSHERLAGEARRAADARERGEEARGSASRPLTEELASREGFGRIVGVAKSWKGILVQVSKVAPTETTVLLTRRVGHRQGDRRARDPPRLVARRGAVRRDQLRRAAGPAPRVRALRLREGRLHRARRPRKPGRIEQAARRRRSSSTRSGEMSPAVQAKLLRVLAGARVPAPRRDEGAEDRRRASSPRRTATSSRRSRAASSARTSSTACRVFEIALPPLRERVEDILPLTEVFLAELGPAIGRPVAGVSKEAKDLLLAYPWPGNVRELKNALERAAILCDGGLITAAHLPISVSGHEASRAGAAAAAGAPGLPPGRRRPRVDGEGLRERGAREGPLQQEQGREAPRPHTRAAVLADREVRAWRNGEEEKEFS